MILKKNHYEDDICMDHLNRMNSIKLTVNMDTALMVHNKWKGLDKRKDDEYPEEFEQRKKMFKKYDLHSKAIMALLNKHTTHFHLTHKYDKRGRVYAQGYHVNYQGTPWNKAVIEFADKELIE